MKYQVILINKIHPRPASIFILNISLRITRNRQTPLRKTRITIRELKYLDLKFIQRFAI
jgi:hypothetical protein